MDFAYASPFLSRDLPASLLPKMEGSPSSSSPLTLKGKRVDATAPTLLATRRLAEVP